jgi:hypothetical protein
VDTFKDIKLIPLNKEFHSTIEMDERFNIAKKFDVPGSYWWTLFDGKQNLGTVGIIIRGKSILNHYFQIAIHQDFRGKDLLKKSITLMFDKFPQSKELLSVIHKDNVASQKAHQKIGFERVIDPNRLTMISPDSYLYVKQKETVIRKPLISSMDTFEKIKQLLQEMFSVDYSNTVLKIHNQPLRNDGTVETRIPPDSFAGSYLHSSNTVILGDDKQLKKAMAYYNVSETLNSFKIIIIAHELAHRAYHLTTKEKKDEILERLPEFQGF